MRVNQISRETHAVPYQTNLDIRGISIKKVKTYFGWKTQFIVRKTNRDTAFNADDKGDKSPGKMITKTQYGTSTFEEEQRHRLRG